MDLRSCAKPGALRWLPGTVGALAGAGPGPDLPDLGPDVHQVDGGGHERDDRQRQEAIEKPDLLSHAADADNQCDAQDDEPQRLGLLARRGVSRGRVAHGVDEGPRLDHERTDQQGVEKIINWTVASESEHGYTLPGARPWRELMRARALVAAFGLRLARSGPGHGLVCL